MIVLLVGKLVMLFVSRSSKVLAVPLENPDVMVQRPCEVEHQGRAGLSFPDLNWKRHVVEPRTGIEFPIILHNILAGEHNSNLCSEVSIFNPLSLLGSCWNLMALALSFALKIDVCMKSKHQLIDY